MLDAGSIKIVMFPTLFISAVYFVLVNNKYLISVRYTYFSITSNIQKLIVFEKDHTMIMCCIFVVTHAYIEYQELQV